MTALIESSKRGDLGAVTHLLLDPTTVIDACVEPSRLTALHFACVGGHVAVAEALIKAGASVRAVSNIGLSPMHAAALAPEHSAALVRLLLSAGAPVSATASDGNTALHIAASNLDAELMEVLTLAGANVSLPGRQGYSPLEMCLNVAGNPVEASAAVSVLLDHGAIVSPRAISLGVQSGNLFGLGFALQRASPSTLAESGALHSSAKIAAGCTDTAMLVDPEIGLRLYEGLLAAGSDPNQRDALGRTAIEAASKSPGARPDLLARLSEIGQRIAAANAAQVQFPLQPVKV